MSVQRRGDLAGGSAADRGGIAFGAVGALLALAGVGSVVTGMPRAAHGLAPLAGFADLSNRFGEFSLLLSAGIAALVAATIVALLGARRLRPGQAGGELIVLGAAIEVCILAASSRVGYAIDGSVLPAAVACLTGGAAVIAAGVVSLAASIVFPAGRQR
jgi:hypothetical protein